MDMDNELICDKILDKFRGNKSFTWDEVHQPEFYNSINSDYYVVENHIKFLLGDDSLQEIGNPPSLSKTPKGWFIMTDSGKFGYVAKRQEERRKETRENLTLHWAKWATIITVISLVIWILDRVWSSYH